MSTPRSVLLTLLLLLIFSFFYLDGQQYLTLEALKAQQSGMMAYCDNHPLQASTLYLLFYIFVTSLSLPGATILTLAGGALFGFWWGVLLVSFASTIGATLAFLAARFLLRDWVQLNFGERLQDINSGIAQEGAWYLFTLRLVPLFPFFIINLLMGLTPIKTGTFYWVSQLGMLAGTLVYVNAGTQLAKLDSVAGILSPALVGSFALLGLFPLLAKKIIAALTA